MNSSLTSLKIIKPEDQSNYRLIEIGKIKDYFNEEIQYQQFSTNKLSKYLTVFDYINKTLTVFLTVFSPTNIFTHVNYKINNNYKITTRNTIKEKKHNRLLYLCKNKLDCIEMLISNSIKYGIIDHNEFLMILEEKKNYDCLKNEDKAETVYKIIMFFFC